MKSYLPILLFTGWLLPFPSSGQVSFTDVTTQAGLSFQGKNYGIAVGDYNRDGYDDLFAISHGQSCRLYQNIGNGSFQEVAAAAGVNYHGTPNAAGWVDADNDGHLDLFIANRDENNIFYRNNGDGTFTDHTFLSGLLTGGKVRALLFSDINKDGLIDIYLARINAQNILFLNIGNSQFINFTNNSGALDPQISMGAVFFDYDNDGDPDLYLTHDANQPNILYQNDGKGYFADVSDGSGANIGTNGMGVDVADVNQDGWLDIYITNLFPNSFLLNNGDGTFTEMAEAAGIGDPGMGWGCTFLDVDNDGWQDIYAVNDSYFSPWPNLLYRNNQDLTFTLDSDGSPLASMEPGYGVATLDFDEDGRMDIYLANYVGDTGNHLFRNDSSADHNWIKIKLEGTVSNRDAIGTRLELLSGDLVLTDELLGTSGYASQNGFTMHFGLGMATVADQLTIRWPNGLVEVFDSLQVNTTHTFLEGEGQVATAVSTVSDNSLNVQVVPNPFKEVIRLQVAGVIHDEMTVVMTDISGTVVFTGRAKCKGCVPEIPVKNLPGGVYFVTVFTKTGTDSRKVVKL